MTKRTDTQLKSDARQDFTSTARSIRYTHLINTVDDLTDSKEHTDNVAMKVNDLTGNAGKVAIVSQNEKSATYKDQKNIFQDNATAGSNITIDNDPNDNTKVRISSTQRGAPTASEIFARLTSGTNVSIETDPNDNTKLRISSTDTNTQRTDEQINDLIQSAIVAGSNVSVDKSDTNNTVTINATQRGAPTAAEIFARLTSGSNVTIETDPNDNTKLRISSTDTNTQRGAPTQSEVYNQLKAIIVDGTNINTTDDDTNNRMTINSTASGGGGGSAPTKAQINNLLTAGSNVTIDDDPNNNTKLRISSTQRGAPTVAEINARLTAGSNINIAADPNDATKLEISSTASGGSDTEVFPDDYDTISGTGTIAMIAGHVEKFNAFTGNSAKEYDLVGTVGTAGQLITLYNSGNGDLTIDNPLSGIPNIVLKRYDSATFKKYVVSNFPFWIHVAIARYEDSEGSGGGVSFTWPTTSLTALADEDQLLIQDDTDTTQKAITFDNLKKALADLGFQFTDTTETEIETTAELPFFNSSGARRNISVADFKSSLGIETETFRNLIEFTQTSAQTGTTFRTTGVDPVIYDEKIYEMSFIPATTVNGDPTTNPDVANRSTYRDTGANLKDALKIRSAGDNSIAADLTLTDQGASRSIRVAWLTDGTILLDPQNWPGIFTMRVVEHITRSTDLPDMPTNGNFTDAADGSTLKKVGDSYTLDPVFEDLFEVVAGASAIFANTNQNPVIYDEKTFRITFTPTASNDRANSGSLIISGEDLDDDLQTRVVGNNSTSADLTLNNDGATRNYRLARLANGNWLFDNQSVAGTLKVEISKDISRITDLEGMPTARELANAGRSQGLVKSATGDFEFKLLFPAPSFYVTNQSALSGSQYTKVITEDDLGRIVGINPGSRTVWVVFPDTLPLDFSCTVISDNGNNGLIRVGCNNMIDRSTNSANLLRQANASSGFPTNLNGVNYIGHDWVDLMWANDELEFTKVNNANWYRVAIKRYIAFEPPLNPSTSGTQYIGRTTTSFTHSYRSISKTKFKQTWVTV